MPFEWSIIVNRSGSISEVGEAYSKWRFYLRGFSTKSSLVIVVGAIHTPSEVIVHPDAGSWAMEDREKPC